MEVRLCKFAKKTLQKNIDKYTWHKYNKTVPTKLGKKTEVFP